MATEFTFRRPIPKSSATESAVEPPIAGASHGALASPAAKAGGPAQQTSTLPARKIRDRAEGSGASASTLGPRNLLKNLARLGALSSSVMPAMTRVGPRRDAPQGNALGVTLTSAAHDEPPSRVLTAEPPLALPFPAPADLVGSAIEPLAMQTQTPHLDSVFATMTLNEPTRTLTAAPAREPAIPMVFLGEVGNARSEAHEKLAEPIKLLSAEAQMSATELHDPTPLPAEPGAKRETQMQAGRLAIYKPRQSDKHQKSIGLVVGFDDQNNLPPDRRSRRLSTSERHQFKAKFENGLLLYADSGKPVHTYSSTSALGGMSSFLFVMDTDGGIYIGPQSKGELSHWSYAANKKGFPVAAAGQVEVKNGEVKYVDSLSGRYLPPEELIDQFASELNSNGVHGFEVEKNIAAAIARCQHQLDVDSTVIPVGIAAVAAAALAVPLVIAANRAK
jgi:hypothetical protein